MLLYVVFNLQYLKGNHPIILEKQNDFPYGIFLENITNRKVFFKISIIFVSLLLNKLLQFCIV
jgi:hypothetical protein